MSDTSKPLIAAFGGTGGCCLQTLSLALKANYEIVALARTPEKLTDLLLKKGVPQTTLDSHLHVTKGDIRDVAAVKGTLASGPRPADIILSGIGATSLSEVSSGTLDLCHTAATNILTALMELKTGTKPVLIALSTTGMTEGDEPRDLPIMMMPIYKIMLANPHKDKLQMEHIIQEHMAGAEGDQVIKGYIFPRPSLLSNGNAKGLSKIHVGMELKPAIGYTISRDDVGLWLFESLIAGTGRNEYLNHKPTLTH